MDPELRHLRYFVAVAEELHFGRAAVRLRMAQPPLSQQIRQLEAMIGTPLFVRTSRSVALTPAGEAYLVRCRRVLAAVSDDLHEASRIGRGEQGRFDIGFVSSAIQLGLAGPIRRFRERHPAVHLRLHEAYTAQIVDRLLSGEVDLGVVRDADDHDDLVGVTFATESFVAVLPADHPHARSRAINAAVLRDDPFVFIPRMAGERAYQRNLRPCLEAGYTPSIVQDAGNWTTVVHLVAAGLGVTIAPASITAVTPPPVAVLPLTGTGATTEVRILRRRDDERVTATGFGTAGRSPGLLAASHAG
ncbi:LysR substrate-binding domain-containing protein [Micromonospora sp. NPDC049751]|uniref:LysR substrate-binding domain-containing protein n=1 Tax=unclassified Micromonospora TaxID=2617518 RepID=UPI00340AB4B7